MKAGDVVKIRSDLKSKKYDGWVASPEMIGMAGHRATITSGRRLSGTPNYSLDIDDGKYAWTEPMFETELMEYDPVNHPTHYTDGGIETIDFIEAKQLPYHLGNAVKYISRAGKKDPDKTKQDLEKAIWYINRYIGTLEVGE